MRGPALCVTGGCMMMGLVFKRFPLCEFSLFDTPRATSGEGDGTLLQYSCLENPMDGEAWWAAVCGVAQSRTRLKQLSSSRATSLEKAVETHSSTLAWKIPWAEEPGRL